MMPSPYRILCVAGARPNFMKLAPLVRAFDRDSDAFVSTIVHTGQHYDAAMSAIFFDQLGIPRPDIELNVGSSSHAQQTAAIMAAFEPVLAKSKPGLVVVVGDVNSTVACSLVAAKLGVPVAHVEAGLRSYDRAMPEEINRVLTDQLSDLLLTTEASAHDNLVREGVAPEKIHFVGNVMIDTLLAHRESASRLDVAGQHGLDDLGGAYGLMTLHRPSNVDDLATFDPLMAAVAVIAEDLPVVFPVHPRTRPMVARSAQATALIEAGRLRLLEPLGYLEFVGLMDKSRVVLTDSGGIQEETTILGVPCLTLRENTERPVTVTEGTNRIVGTDPEKITAGWKQIQASPPTGQVPALWDGKAAERIVDVVRAFLSAG